MESVGFVGVGRMGEGMASCVLRAGAPLTVVAHRSRHAVDRLRAKGAAETMELASLADSVDVIVLCVSDAGAVEATIQALKPTLQPGQLVIDASTSDPALTQRLAGDLAGQGIRFADAPVTGGPAEAVAGRLGTLLGAAPPDVERVRTIVGCWSAVVRHVGEPGAGHTAKLLNNFVTQGTTILLAEAYDRARRAGVDWHALYDAMQAGAARSGTLEKAVRPALAGDYDGARFTMDYSLKDLQYYNALASAMDGEPSLIASALTETLAAFVNAGHGAMNISRLLDPEIRRRDV